MKTRFFATMSDRWQLNIVTSLYFTYFIHFLLYFVPSSGALLSFFIFVDKQVVTAYKQMGLLGPCRVQDP